MSQNITNLMVTQFQANLRLAAQAMDSRLMDCVEIESGIEGDLSSPVTIIGALTAQKKTSRNSDTVYSNVDYDRRWYEPTAYQLSDLFDWDDVIKVSGPYDPKSNVLRAFVAGLKRACDDRILAAMFATSKTGVKGGSTTSFDSNNIVPLSTGGANSGLNVAKLKAGVEIFLGNDVDEEDMLYCAITARQNKELLKEIEVLKSDYRQTAVIENGRLKSFMGITFKHVQWQNASRYPDANSGLIDGSSDFLVPMWAKSGVALGLYKDIEGKMDIIPTKNYSTQIYASNMVGATRTEEEKVVQIVCYGS